jgi:hypothetical protein
MSARPEEAEEGAKSENAEMLKLEIGKVENLPELPRKQT